MSAATQHPEEAPGVEEEEERVEEQVAGQEDGGAGKSKKRRKRSKRKKKKQNDADADAATPAPAPAPNDTTTTATTTATKKKKKKKKKKRKRRGLCPYEDVARRVTAEPMFPDAPEPDADDDLSRVVNTEAGAAAVPFSIRVLPGRGRGAVATRDLSPGEQVVREAPVEWCASRGFEGKVCYTCANEVPSGFMVRRLGLYCDTCKRAVFCSEECKTAGAEMHGLECAVLAEADELAQRLSMDPFVVRLCLRHIVCTGLKKRHDEQSHFDADGTFHASLKAYEQQAVEPGEVTEEQRQALVGMAEAVLAKLPSDFAVPLEEIVQAITRIRTNAHALSMASSYDDSGFGVFPLASILNHSCWPNCLFRSEGNRIVFRAIRPIKAGEELTVSYIALYSSRSARRLELRHTKQFECTCCRCQVLPPSEDAVDAFAADEHAGWLRCKAHQEPDGGDEPCPGYYRLYIIDNGDEPDDEVYRCTECDHKLTAPEFESYELRTANLTQALAGRVQAATDVDDATEVLKAVREPVKRIEVMLHPLHFQRYNLYRAQINALLLIRDYPRAVELMRVCIDMASSVLPRIDPVITDLLQGLARFLPHTIEHKQHVPKTALRILREERRGALERAIEIWTVLHGPDHPKTVAARDMLDSL